MADRTCSLPGCGNPHRARGYCSTHYNRIVCGEAKRHPKVATACVVCATPVIRRGDVRYQPTCSVRCRTIVQVGELEAQPLGLYDWRVDAVQRARKRGARIVDQFDREVIFERDAWQCQACGIRCSSPNPFERTAATVDHIVCLARGGEHSRANAQTLCLGCNSAKQARGISPAA